MEAWKPDWELARKRHCQWWKHEGFVVGSWSGQDWGEASRLAEGARPEWQPDIRRRYEDAEWRSRWEHWQMSRLTWPLDTLPQANTNIGPGSLALGLGSEPGFSEHTVWFHPCWGDLEELKAAPPLRFDPGAHWYEVHRRTCEQISRLAAGRYLVGCPDLIENLDILASLRGTENLLEDLLEEPAWVAAKVEEIDAVWIACFEHLRPHLVDTQGGNAFSAFAVYGPGRTAKIQCDISALIGPAHFERFVVPSLTRQCAHLDYSIFHLDGSDCLQHLDHLLAIDRLKAIEWTPDPKVPSGGDPCWYPLYRRILAAGKAVQAIGLRAEEVIPLLDAVGTRGVYAMPNFRQAEEARRLEEALLPYR